MYTLSHEFKCNFTRFACLLKVTAARFYQTGSVLLFLCCKCVWSAKMSTWHLKMVECKSRSQILVKRGFYWPKLLVHKADFVHPVLSNKVKPAPPRPTQFQKTGGRKKIKTTAASWSVGGHIQICSNNPDSQSCSSSVWIIIHCRVAGWVGRSSDWWCRWSAPLSLAWNRICNWLRENVAVWSRERLISARMGQIWWNRNDLLAERILLCKQHLKMAERDFSCWSSWLQFRWRHLIFP